MARSKSSGRKQASSTAKARTKGKAKQSEAKFAEDRVVDPRGARVVARSFGTATGRELARATQEGAGDIPTGADRGAKDVPEVSKDGKPIGLQKEDAMLLTNGTVEPGTVATASGPVPVAAVVASAEDGAERMEREKKSLAANRFGGPTYHSNQRLPEDVVNRLSGAELRSIAHQRGYDIGANGTQTTRLAFSKAQEEDKGLED
jgi:hypothetical protein